MTVTVLLFASYADAFGRSSIDLSLPASSTVADALRMLRDQTGADRLPPRPLVAVNAEYADVTSTLHAGDELAVIPPVAGG